MFNKFKKLLKRKPLSKYKVNQDYFFDIPTNCMGDMNLILNRELDDSYFEDNVVMYNCGYNFETNMFKMLIIKAFGEVSE